MKVVSNSDRQPTKKVIVNKDADAKKQTHHALETP